MDNTNETDVNGLRVKMRHFRCIDNASTSLRRQLSTALGTLQGLRVELEDQHQLLAKTRFLRSNNNSANPQETLKKVAHSYMGISRLISETHAAVVGMLRQLRNGKQLEEQLQQQQKHFSGALGRVDSFAHSLQQLQQLVRQEEQRLQQQQHQTRKLMDHWSRGEVELQQKLLRTVLGFAAADARHLDALKDCWIHVTPTS